MNANQCCGANPSCDVGKSIYTDKTDTGKVFPNAFKPKWQTELEKQKPTKPK